MRKILALAAISPLYILMMVLLSGILLAFTQIDWEIWQHLAQYLLGDALLNSLAVTMLVCLIVLGIALPAAWLTSNFDFFGSKFFSWALILPLTIPPYVMSLVHIDMLDYSGFVQSFLRHKLGLEGELWHARSRWGLSITLAFSLFPYVYLFSKAGFATLGRNMFEAARSMQLTNIQTFFKLALPMAKPWWMAGLVLVSMEVLADFGAFSAFNISNLATLIYKLWFSLFDLNAALQLAFFSVLIGFLLMAIQTWFLRKKRYYSNVRESIERLKIKGLPGFIASLFLGMIFLICFILPMIWLCYWGINTKLFALSSYWPEVLNSITLAFFTALLCLLLAVLMSLIHRFYKFRSIQAILQLSTIGYAIPSIVIAAGLYLPFIYVSNGLSNITGFNEAGQGTVIVVIFLLAVKLVNVSYNATSSSLSRVDVEYENVAATFGLSKFKTSYKIYLPLMNKGLIVAFLLVFIDVLKELPITLVSRPLAWDSLAVKVYELTSAGMFKEAAAPSLFIVLAGIVVTIISIKLLDGEVNAK